MPIGNVILTRTSALDAVSVIVPATVPLESGRVREGITAFDNFARRGGRVRFDVNVTALTGLGVQFFVESQWGDGVWQTAWASSPVLATGPITRKIGTGQGMDTVAALSSAVRIRTVLNRTVTDGVTVIGLTVTSATANFTSADVGKSITGGSIPAGATIASVQSTTSMTLDAGHAATAGASGVTLVIGSTNATWQGTLTQL